MTAQAQYDYDDGRAEALFSELAQVGGDDRRREEILSELVALHTPLVRHLAMRYARRGEPIEDIQQAAMLGLVKAINRYDPTIGRHGLRGPDDVGRGQTAFPGPHVGDADATPSARTAAIAA